MAEYIERKTVIDHLEKLFQLQARTARAIIEAVPAADVAPVRHGRWKWHLFKAGTIDVYGHECSVCGAITPVNVDRYKYCPNCGALMDKEDTNG